LRLIYLLEQGFGNQQPDDYIEIQVPVWNWVPVRPEWLAESVLFSLVLAGAYVRGLAMGSD